MIKQTDTFVHNPRQSATFGLNSVHNCSFLNVSTRIELDTAPGGVA